MATALFDAQGCLTAGPSRASRPLRPAPPLPSWPHTWRPAGAASAACWRRRWDLSPRAAPRRERPPLWRTVVAVIACLLLVMVAMIMMQYLAARR